MAFTRPRSRVQPGAATVRGAIEPLSYVLFSGVSETAQGHRRIAPKPWEPTNLEARGVEPLSLD
jgi:hypothetical protein